MGTVSSVAGAALMSVILTLSGLFHDGAAALKAGRNEEAIAAFTKVIESEAPEAATFRDASLFYRAVALKAEKKDKLALADLLALIKLKDADTQLVARARGLYSAWGGDPSKIAPAVSPKKVFAAFIDALKKGDVKKALTYCDPKGMIYKMMAAHPEAAGDVPPFAAEKEFIGDGEAEGMAFLQVTVPGDMGPGIDSLSLIFVLDPTKTKWLMKTLDVMEMENIQRGGGEYNNVEKLWILGCMLRLRGVMGRARRQSEDQEAFPPNLAAVFPPAPRKLNSKQDFLVWISPDDPTDKRRFFYQPGHSRSDPVGTIIAAAPKPWGGYRLALFVDGHVECVPEKDFVAQAKKQKWMVPGMVKKEDLSKERIEAIRGLVERLGSDKFAVRKDAFDKLDAMGMDAFPILEEYRNHKDPEVRISIRKLLNP